MIASKVTNTSNYSISYFKLSLYKNIRVCFSSSSGSPWNEMLQEVFSQPLITKPRKEVTVKDRILARNTDDDNLVLLFRNDTEKHLRSWVSDQRASYKRQLAGRGKSFTKDKIDALNEHKFIWDPKEFGWYIRLNELKMFQRENRHSIVPRGYKHFPKLGQWVRHMRSRKNNQDNQLSGYKSAKLSDKQISDLNNLNFEWDPIEAQWLEKFHELKEFININGHVHVTRSNCSNISLWQWVNRQRITCKLDHRRELLDSIGFAWNGLEVKDEIHEAQWLEKFHKLQSYYEANGHTKVTRSMNRRLAEWVARQRYECKKEDRIKMLNSIDFVWSKSSDDLRKQ